MTITSSGASFQHSIGGEQRRSRSIIEAGRYVASMLWGL
jgi:hypothetical protein